MMVDYQRRFSASAEVRRDEFVAITGAEYNSYIVNQLITWAQKFANEVRDSVLCEAAIIARDLRVETEWKNGKAIASRTPSPLETERTILAAREAP